MTRSPSLCALPHSPVWFLDVEGPLRVEQRKELLLPVVLLCGEKDAAKVVAAKGEERERGGCESSSVIQSEGRREGGRTILSCMLCSRYRLHVRGFLATVCIGYEMKIRMDIGKDDEQNVRI